MTLPPLPHDPAGAAAAAARFAATAPADVAYAVVDSPIGRLVAAVTERGLVRLAYEDFNGGLDAVLDAGSGAIPIGTWRAAFVRIRRLNGIK